MAEDSDLEKTEQASPKRLEKAREDGDVPRSRELSTTAILLAMGLSMLAMGNPLQLAMRSSLEDGLSFDRAAAYDFNVLIMKISHGIGELLISFIPLALIMLLIPILSSLMIGGLVFSGKALTPNFSRLNPIKGLANLFSSNALMELVKAIFKTILVAVVAYFVLLKNIEPMLSITRLPLNAGIGEVNHLLLMSFFAVVSALIFIALIDVPFQLFHYANKLKMTKEEVRQESKESDGKPEIKARVRQQQREMSRRRMMAEIPNADVVITNPTHYAVAIKYKEGQGAPIVLAKGADEVALKIREIAKEHQITTLEAPKLARALYAHTELNKEIPEKLYAAVAEVLAYVFQMRIFKQEGGFNPELPSSLPVPDDLDPHFIESQGTGLDLGIA